MVCHIVRATVEAHSQVEERLTEAIRASGLDVSWVPYVTEAIFRLSRYREEDRRLFPRLLLSKGKPSGLGFEATVELGASPQREVLRLALKHGATLALGAWAIWVEHRNGKHCRYAVVRLDASPVAIDSLRRPKDLGAPWLLLEQVGPNVVLVTTPVAETVVSLAETKLAVLPFEEVERVASIATRKLPGQLREPGTTLLSRTLLRAMTTGHGCLLCLVPSGTTIPECLEAGVKLESPVGCEDALSVQSTAELLAVQGYASLLVGMLASDGAVVMDTRARILGYRCFAKNLEVSDGGARRRAFESLKKERRFQAVVYKSSDGPMLVHGAKQ